MTCKQTLVSLAWLIYFSDIISIFEHTNIIVYINKMNIILVPFHVKHLFNYKYSDIQPSQYITIVYKKTFFLNYISCMYIVYFSICSKNRFKYNMVRGTFILLLMCAFAWYIAMLKFKFTYQNKSNLYPVVHTSNYDSVSWPKPIVATLLID